MNDTSRPSRSLPTRSTSLLLVLLASASMMLVGVPTADAAPVVATPAIVPFTDWAPAACPTPTGSEASPVRRLVVHHTHEPVAHTPDEVLPALALTCKAHTSRGFSTIGYHYVVDPWGAIYQGRGGLPQADGSPPATQAKGAHVAGTNSGAVGVVFLGDHEDAPPTAAALTAGTHLMAWLLEPTGLDPGERVPVNSTGAGTARQTGRFHPRAMTGHSASNHTACPGEHLRELLPEIYGRMRQLLAGQQPAGWQGLAVDRLAPSEQAPKGKKPNDNAAPKGKKANDNPAPKGKKANDNAAPKADTAADAGAGGLTDGPEKSGAAPGGEAIGKAPAVPVGPLASPADVLARGLREVGLLSLADRISRPLDG